MGPERLKAMIQEAKNIVAFTGAGISAESGIPTYRGSGGVWNKYDPEKYANVNEFTKDPSYYWSFFKEIRRKIFDRINMISRIRRDEREIFSALLLTKLKSDQDLLQLLFRFRCLEAEATVQVVVHGQARVGGQDDALVLFTDPDQCFIRSLRRTGAGKALDLK